MGSRAAELPGLDLREDDFRLIAGIVHREAGILIRDHKQAMVRGRLARRVRELGLGSISAYCARLKGPALADELPGLLNVLTTNHTAFFREAHHFAHMAHTALPALAPNGAAGVGRFRVWSVASSSGEEPYAIAATLHTFAGKTPFRDLKLLATDIDTDMLARGEQGTYSRSALQALAPAQQQQLLPEPGDGPESWRVGVALRRMVAFRRLNIVEDWPFRGPFQIIVCRNMLIYFDPPTKQGVIARLLDRLAPGGFLYLGHSEALTQTIAGLEPCGRTIYRKV